MYSAKEILKLLPRKNRFIIAKVVYDKNTHRSCSEYIQAEVTQWVSDVFTDGITKYTKLREQGKMHRLLNGLFIDIAKCADIFNTCSRCDKDNSVTVKLRLMKVYKHGDTCYMIPSRRQIEDAIAVLVKR